MLLIFVFIIYFPLIVLAFFDFSSLRTDFWPLPFPSENFGGHGEKVMGDRGRAFAEASAYAQSYGAMRRVTHDTDVTDSEKKRRDCGRRAGTTKGNEENEGSPQPGQNRNPPLFLCVEASTANGHQFLK